MLTELAIRGFQPHGNFTLPLGRVTTLVGPSDGGKSAVLRAVRWVCLNQPAGDSFVTEGLTKCLVRVTIDGHKVVRVRSKERDNYYRLDGRKMKPFGVPDPVRDLLLVCEDNFQDQLDPPFWLTLPPAEASRRMNVVVNLGEIDEIVSRASKDTHRLKTVVAVSRERLKIARTKRDDLTWAEAFAVKVGKLVKLEERKRLVAERLHRIDSLISGAAEALGDARDRSSAIPGPLAAVRAYEKWQAQKAKVTRLDELVNKLTQTAELQTKAIPNSTDVQLLWKKRNKVYDRVRKLDSLVFGLSVVSHEAGECRTKINDLRKRLKEAPGRCPTCGRTIQKATTS